MSPSYSQRGRHADECFRDVRVRTADLERKIAVTSDKQYSYDLYDSSIFFVIIRIIYVTLYGAKTTSTFHVVADSANWFICCRCTQSPGDIKGRG